MTHRSCNRALFGTRHSVYSRPRLHVSSMASNHLAIVEFFACVERCLVRYKTAGFMVLATDTNHAVRIVLVRTITRPPSCLRDGEY